MSLKFGDVTPEDVRFGSEVVESIYWGDQKIWPDEVAAQLIGGLFGTDTSGVCTGCSVTQNDMGRWTVTFNEPLADTEYLVFFAFDRDGGTGTTTGSVRIRGAKRTDGFDLIQTNYDASAFSDHHETAFVVIHRSLLDKMNWQYFDWDGVNAVKRYGTLDAVVSDVDWHVTGSVSIDDRGILLQSPEPDTAARTLRMQKYVLYANPIEFYIRNNGYNGANVTDEDMDCFVFSISNLPVGWRAMTFDETGTAIHSNGLSITRTDAGVYTVTIDEAMANTDYLIVATTVRTNDNDTVRGRFKYVKVSESEFTFVNQAADGAKNDHYETTLMVIPQ